MDNESLQLLLSQNTATIKSFVQMMIDQCRTELNSIKTENVELKQSLEFCHGEISDLKLQIAELKSVCDVNTNSDLSTRVMKLEDGSRKKNYAFRA